MCSYPHHHPLEDEHTEKKEPATVTCHVKSTAYIRSQADLSTEHSVLTSTLCYVSGGWEFQGEVVAR